MVEKSADILAMGKGQPQPLAWHARVDAALRRTRGLGIFIVGTLVEYWWDRNLIIFGMILLAVAASLAEEFIKLPGERGFTEHRES